MTLAGARVPRIVAHRGAELERPENTMEAFERARSHGADAIEFDVHQTRDGALIVHHDFLVDRTTSGSGWIGEHDLASVRALDAGGWFAPEFAGLRVPLLDEVLALYDLEFEIELKGCTRLFLDDVLAAVLRAGVLERTEFTSWNSLMIQALKAARPSARVGLFTLPRPPWMPETVFRETVLGSARFGEFDVVHVRARDITPAIVDAIHESGYLAHANDAFTDVEVQGAIDAGADRLSTPDVAMAVQVRSARFGAGEV